MDPDKEVYLSLSFIKVNYELAQKIIKATTEAAPGVSYNVFYEDAIDEED